MIERAAKIYSKYNNDDEMEKNIEDVLTLTNQLVGRRNDIAHGIVQPLIAMEDNKNVIRGVVLYPAFYATQKRKLKESHQLSENSTHFTIEPTYVYSSVEINSFGNQFGQLANRAIDVLTFLSRREQARIHASM